MTDPQKSSTPVLPGPSRQRTAARGASGLLAALLLGGTACTRTPAPAGSVDALVSSGGRADSDGGVLPDASPSAVKQTVVTRLLARLHKPCQPCGVERAGDLFELGSLLTTRDRAEATPEVIAQAVELSLAALGDPHVEVRTPTEQLIVETALATLGVMAATLPDARQALHARGASARIRALLDEPPAEGREDGGRTERDGGPAAPDGGGPRDAEVSLREPTQRERGRSLFLLGALIPAYDEKDAAGREPDRALLRAGLFAPQRLVQRQAVLGATLARDEALDPALLGSLRRLLTQREPRGDKEDTATDTASELARLTIPATLPPVVANELLPLLPAYVDLLLSLPGTDGRPDGSALALRLVQAAVRAAPQSGIAHFFLAQVQSARHDPAATAELRAALSLGNLPAAFVESLGADAQALVEKPNLVRARAEVRRLLAARKPDPASLSDGTRRVTLKMLDAGEVRFRTVAPRALEQRAQAVLAGPGAGSPEALQLGAELFASYPFSSETYYDPCLRSFFSGNNRDLIDALGLQHEEASPERRVVVGVVRTVEPSESPSEAKERLGVTCAVCHAQVDAGGRRWDGLPSRSYDPGLLLAACVDQPIHDKAGNRNLAELLDYRPGRNDSSSDGVHNPTDIPSLLGLRAHGPLPVRWTGDTPTLENQIDRNLSPHSAPPAVIALVAGYLRSLPLPEALSPQSAGTPPAAATGSEPAGPRPGKAAPLPSAAAPAPAEVVTQGQAVFARLCQHCHEGPAFTSGQIVPLGVVGTDPTRISAVLPNSTEGYKVPSLLRISRTAPYLHDGSVPTLESFFELGGTRRPAATGHRFGLELPVRERAALLAFLRTL